MVFVMTRHMVTITAGMAETGETLQKLKFANNITLS